MAPSNGDGYRAARPQASIELDGVLPDWSARSTDPSSYSMLVSAAAQFNELPEVTRADAVRTYAQRYCLPRFDLPKASGLYLLLRAVFGLPARHPREQVKVFGGWLHPSINDGSPFFDLSWPIHVDQADAVMSVAMFPGYFGKGYDATGEYDWMRAEFPFREMATLKRLQVRTER